MTVSITCDAKGCGKPCRDVAVVVSTVPADEPTHHMLKPRYYHYGCVVTFGTDERPPNKYMLRDPRGWWADDKGKVFTNVAADVHLFDAHRAVELLSGGVIAGLTAVPTTGG